MKRLFLTTTLIAISFWGRSQSSKIQEYTDSVRLAKTDTDRAINLYFLSYYYQNYKPDSALYLAQTAYDISEKEDFLRGKIGSLGQMAKALNNLGNYPKALEYYLEQLKILEKKKDPEDIASSYISIALVYSSQKDFDQALFYAHKADSLARVNHLRSLILYTTLDLGDIYSKYEQPDSALFYTRLCYIESVSQNNELITGTALNNMGNINFHKGIYDLALDKYRSSIPFLSSMQDYNTLAECYLGLARTFDKLDRRDSALYYAEKSYKLASENQFLKHSIASSNFLTQLYSQENNISRAFSYQQTYIALKDSFDNSEKVKELQNLTITEQLRQQQLAKEKTEQDKARRLKLELLFLGMCIPLLFLLSAFLSGRKVARKVVEFSAIFSLLFLFEYITLLIHPVVVDKAGHSPFFEIIIFVAIAAVISPSHHKIEAWLKHRLTRRHHSHSNTVEATKGH